ncbi:MAG: HNH endonuclease [Candidatus Scalindua sp.]|nr:HNH endonuclease [Candidatus Scalindua sp.]
MALDLNRSKKEYKCSTCSKCFSRYHIQKWSEYVKGRFDMNNCRTLCAKCHYQITFGKPMPESVQGWGHNLLGGVDP